MQRANPFIAPCEPTLRAEPPSGPGWLHEVKFDGYRIQLHKDGGDVALYSENGNDFTCTFRRLRGRGAADDIFHPRRRDHRLQRRRYPQASLILHKLATNASKYGALLNDSVSIAWSTTGQGEEVRFQFQWLERGGPEVSQPARKGFGTTLLEGALAVDGATPPKLSFDAGGLSYGFEVPLSTVTDH